MKRVGPQRTLEGDTNGAPHPDSSSYAKKFSGKYVHRIIKGGVGHNLPQEARRPLPKLLSMSTVIDRLIETFLDAERWLASGPQRSA
jgi:hypothetical protein